MYVETAPQAADGDEEFRKIRVLTQKLRELIDDDNQGRQGPMLTHGGSRSVVLTDIGKVSGGAQQLLAPVHLARDGIVHALYQSRFLLQVGDHRGSMRQAVAA